MTPTMKYVSIDIETTGLDPETCQVLEFGAVIDDWKTPIEQLPVFRRIMFHRTVTGTPYAMALNADLLRQIANPPTNALDRPGFDGFCLPEDLGYQFAAWLRSCSLDPKYLQAAGKNFGTFDLQFLKRLPRFNQSIDFCHRVLDPAILFWQSEDEKFPDSKTCYERAGIDTKVAHTAVEDALAVVRLVRIGITRLLPSVQEQADQVRREMQQEIARAIRESEQALLANRAASGVSKSTNE